MAGVAAFNQQWADLGFEELDLGRLENLGLLSAGIGGLRSRQAVLPGIHPTAGRTKPVAIFG